MPMYRVSLAHDVRFYHTLEISAVSRRDAYRAVKAFVQGPLFHGFDHDWDESSQDAPIEILKSSVCEIT